MIDNAKVVMAIFCLCFQPDKVKKKKKDELDLFLKAIVTSSVRPV